MNASSERFGELSINGFRRLSDVRLPLRPLSVMIGANGTGKTSVQLFGKYCDDAKAGNLKDVQATFGCPGKIIP